MPDLLVTVEHLASAYDGAVHRLCRDSRTLEAESAVTVLGRDVPARLSVVPA